MLSTSVSNLDLYRVWREQEDMDLKWLLDRLLRKVEQTPAMMAGEAFHKALELAGDGYSDTMESNGYRFQVQCDIEIAMPRFRELSISSHYGPLQVRGRVDAIDGNMVIDHKTTGQFDSDRLISGYQWRYYLDMLGAERFRWNVFVLRETDEEHEYLVSDFHQLEQHRYPELHHDCCKLAEDYTEFARDNLQTA